MGKSIAGKIKEAFLLSDEAKENTEIVEKTLDDETMNAVEEIFEKFIEEEE